ncbi:FG-GAP repeat domain-containing protein, partial [Singulisphaera rosea]
ASPVGTSRALAVGDMNNDGNLDLVTSGPSPQLTLGAAELFGDGTGSFKSVNIINFTPVSESPTAVGDINGDGRLDVVFSTTGAFFYALQDATGSFPADVLTYLQLPTPVPTDIGASVESSGSIALADFDGDLKPDLVALPLSSRVVNVYPNQGGVNGYYLDRINPSLITLSDSSYWTLVAADVNGDGLNDLVVTDSNASTGASFVLLNKSPVNQPLAILVTTGQNATVNFTSSQLAPNLATPSAQITGVVFDDANGDGKREAGDVPREGAVVYLDLNRNGKLDPS